MTAIDLLIVAAVLTAIFATLLYTNHLNHRRGESWRAPEGE